MNSNTLKSGTLLLAVAMFVILAVMIVPVPPALLDLSISFNIAFSLVVHAGAAVLPPVTVARVISRIEHGCSPNIALR